MFRPCDNTLQSSGSPSRCLVNSASSVPTSSPLCTGSSPASLVMTLVLGVFHVRERRVARFTLLAAAGVYLAALFFRTIDNEVCTVLPIGTHFLWHLLIGLVTYLAMRPLILSAATGVRARVR